MVLVSGARRRHRFAAVPSPQQETICSNPCGGMGMPVWKYDGMQSEVVKGVSGAVRTLTIRLPASEARRAELVARAESISVNELTRRALTAYSDNRCANEEFLAHARALVEQDAALIDGSR